MAHFVELWEFECERGAITTIPFFSLMFFGLARRTSPKRRDSSWSTETFSQPTTIVIVRGEWMSWILNAAMCNIIGCSFCCRFLCHILPCPSATTAIQAENMERDIIHAWFRCLLQLPPSHEGLTELTRYPTSPSLREFVTRGRICD